MTESVEKRNSILPHGGGATIAQKIIPNKYNNIKYIGCFCRMLSQGYLFAGTENAK